jgi:phosphoribosylformimino-5-aminoimidazole carboxamide ribotide isomerase
MEPFRVFPAIDLFNGMVVRLRQGDPTQQTIYDDNAGQAARRWLDAGASWLHVVNLDGAFGESRSPNQAALDAILREAGHYHAHVQFGGGLRSLKDITTAFIHGVERVVLGTAAIEQPELVAEAIVKYHAKRLAIGLDTRAGYVQVRGWQQGTSRPATDTAREMLALGVRWFIVTDIVRDGMGSGLNLGAIRAILAQDGAQVIASGGVAGVEDVRAARAAGCAGIIIGRALYDGNIDIVEAVQMEYIPNDTSDDMLI